MNDMLVAQLHRTLVDALRRTRPAALDQPVTVAEIYQDLVPYRTARAAIGVEMNADYEHALLRLLAGEGDLARIEPREVRDKLRLELESPNPDVGLYRDYAACDVWVSVADAEMVEAAPQSWEEEFVGPAAEQPQPAQAAPVDTPPQPHDEETSDRFADATDEPPARTKAPFQIAGAEPLAQPTQQTADDADECVICGVELPVGRMVNFCPHCGSDQSQQPCPTCGEMLEPLWRFCVACGARVLPAGDHVN